jgi:adenosine deaminase
MPKPSENNEGTKPVKITEQLLRSIPKVLLHDHLDGGLRPETVVELARAHKVALPEEDPVQLSRWFHEGANKGNLREYLKGFKVTTQVMQTEEALTRVAFEMMEDMKRDGVVYIETRFAPVFHTRLGLSYGQVIEAVLRGLRDGERTFGVRFGLILCGMRNMKPSHSLETAEYAVRYREQGVVGFDLAGDELGYPPKDHLKSFHLIQRNNFNITIHAGEAFGKESIWQALQYCGTHRIGHGIHLKDDVMTDGEKILEMGYISQYVRDKRIPLELCLSSNLHTGAVLDPKYNPFPIFHKNAFRVTLNTDNRLMSDTTLTKEYMLAVMHYGIGLKDIEKLSINAMKSAFLHYPERLDIIYNSIKPGFQKVQNVREDLRRRPPGHLTPGAPPSGKRGSGPSSRRSRGRKR